MFHRIAAFIRDIIWHPLVPVFVVIMAAVTLTTFVVMVNSQRRIIEHEAIKIAEVVARQALASRSVYTSAVADKLMRDGSGSVIAADAGSGHVPLPAQFLKLVGREASANSAGLYRYRPLSKWNLEPTQGLIDDFQKWAWDELERQDLASPVAPIEWKAAWRFEPTHEGRALRYMRADPAASESCVNCHNHFEKLQPIRARRTAAGVTPGRQFKRHQLLGAIEVTIPVDRVEAIAVGQAHQTLTLVMSISLVGLTVAGWYAFNDSRRKQALAAKFEHQARYDALTGLANRTQFHERAREALWRAARDSRMVGILFLDVDHFKRINDSLGHPFGDAVLKEVSHRLLQSLRGVDVVARQSGDEFTILLHGEGQLSELARVARKLLEVIALPMQIGKQELFLSASAGISCYPQDGQDVETLLRNADVAMYRAKERGRNNYQFFSADMNHRALETLMLTNNLHQAVERDQLLLHYQPRVDARTGAVRGLEALLRWNHPELGLIEPERFIQLAEDTGMIESIGRWVLATACQQARRWTDAGLPPLRIAVNLSTCQFRAADLLEVISTTLRESALDPCRLELEITESVLVQQAQATEMVLAQLHGMGVTIAIDDFGTGYSSLSYLKRFPIDFLKIDKSFIDGLPGDNNDRAICEAIIALARSLRLKLVAEGVETAEQRAFLEARGCDELQGFLFSIPLPAHEIEPLLRRGRIAA